MAIKQQDYRLDIEAKAKNEAILTLNQQLDLLKK